MLIRFALHCFGLAFLLLLAMTGVMHAGWFGLANLLRLLGTEVMVLGALVFVSLGCKGVLSAVLQHLRSYCSALSRAQRRLSYSLTMQANQQRAFNSYKQQQLYIAESQRQRLLRKNTRLHCQALAASLQQDLHVLRPNLTRKDYRQLHKQLNLFSQRGDVNSLLELQQHLLTEVSDRDAGYKTLDNVVEQAVVRSEN